MPAGSIALTSPDDAYEIVDATAATIDVLSRGRYSHDQAVTVVTSAIMTLCTEWMTDPGDFVAAMNPQDGAAPQADEHGESSPAGHSVTREPGWCHGEGSTLFCAEAHTTRVVCSRNPVSEMHDTRCGEPDAIISQGDGCTLFANGDVDCGPRIETWEYGACAPHPTDGDVVCTTAQGDYFCRGSASPRCGEQVLRYEEMDCSIYWDGSQQCF